MSANVRVNQDLHEAPFRVHWNSGIAVHPAAPRTLVVTDTARRTPSAPVQLCYRHLSTDGGVSWHTSQLPIPSEMRSCNAHSPPRFAADGTLFAAGVTGHSEGPWSSIVVWRSGNAGATFDPPVVAFRGSGGLAGSTTAAGRVSSSVPYLVPDPYNPSQLYLSFSRCEQNNASICRPTFVRSEDGGRSWSSPVFMAGPRYFSTTATQIHPTFDVLAGGELVGLFWDSKNTSATAGPVSFSSPTAGPLVLTKSIDGGVSFTTKEVGVALDYPVRGRLGVDRSRNHIYFVYEDQRPDDHVTRVTGTTFLPSPGRRRIIYLRSTDGGSTWNRERVLSSGATNEDQMRPILAIAPNGRVDVWWYGTAFQSVANWYDVTYTWSDDGGETFGPEIRVTTAPIDATQGPADGAYLFFHHMSALDDAAHIVWTDTREGDGASATNDTYYARVTHSSAE